MNYSILIVEDSEFQLELLREYFHLQPLMHAAFDVAFATTLVEAIATVQQRSFDAVLLDLSLPDSTGIETFRRMQAASDGTPVIVWSADSDEDIALTAMREGAQEYLLKGEITHAQLVRSMRHIIERARADREMRKARTQAERLQQHIESMTSGFAVYDHDFRITYINHALAEMVGSRVEDLTGRILWDAFPDARGTAYDVELNAAMRERHPVAFEMHYQPLDLWVEVRADPVPEGLVVYINDITETKHARAELADRERRISTILESTPDCVKLIDTDGIVLQMNNMGLQLLEADADEVIGRSILNFIPEEHHARVIAMSEDVFGGGSVTAEYEIITLTGSRRWVNTRAVPLRDNEGAITAALCVTRDVTMQKHTEHALQESEEYFRLLVDNLSDAVSLIDPSGRILYLSNVIEEVLGYKPDEALGDYCWDWVHPDDVDLLRKRAIERLRGDETPVFSEVRMRHRDGGWRDIQMRARAYPGGRYGEPALLITLRDVTEAKRTQEDLHRTQQELLHAQKLEAIGRLAGGVAHDFNNLLTAIGGHADLLRDQLAGDVDVLAELDEIKHGVNRAASLTRQLLAFGRKQVMQPVVIDLNDVIDSLRKMLARLIGENIDLVMATRAPDATIRADRGQIEQVLMNLAVNARDAMPRGGRITIATDHVTIGGVTPHVSGAVPGDYVRMQVADTGVGMSKDVLELIFEPFFTTKDVGKGTGLGLATVYGIVRQSGGYITVSSKPQEGSTFELLFPRVQGKADRSALPIRAVDEERATGTVLVVEDERAVRDVACRVLRRAGYQVLSAADGMEALELGSESLAGVDLVLTDVIMPRLNGPDLVIKLREMQPDVRVLFTSGYTDNAVFPAPLDNLAFLEKPFTPATLLQAVRSAIGA